MTAPLIPIGIFVLLAVSSWCRRGKRPNRARGEEQPFHAQAWVELAAREEFGMPIEHPENLTSILPWSQERTLIDLDRRTEWDPEVAE